MEENQHKMNDAKTEFIVLGTSYNLRKNTLDNVEIGKTKIHWTSKIKFLGVYLDKQLNLKDHIQNRKKANYNLMLICNTCKYINIDTTKMLLYTLILSQLEYVNSIQSRAPTTTMKPYQTTQIFAARIAYKKSRRKDVYTCLQELHWLQLLTIVCNALQGQAPQYFKEKLKHKHFSRTTRQSK